MAKRKKHSRPNKAQRDKAKQLVKLWYLDRCERREERFRAVNAQPVLLQSVATQEQERVAQQPWNVPLTAHGVETRPKPTTGGIVHAMDVDASGDFTVHPDLRFIHRAMLELINAATPDHHKALEMDAAGYDVDGIAEELGCGERLARELRGEGIAVIGAWMLVRKHLPW